MDGCARAAVAGLVVAAAGLTGCVAPDAEVVGALGVTVDEQGRPVLVVEACEAAAAGVELFLDRTGLDGDEENEQVGAWEAPTPATGTSRLVLAEPAAPWSGEPVEVAADRGYVATATGEGEEEVLSQVAFRGADLAALEAGTVYTNDPDPDVPELSGRSAEEFSTQVCDRE